MTTHDTLVAPGIDHALAPRVTLLWRLGAAIPLTVLLLVTGAIAGAVGRWLWLLPVAVVILGLLAVGVMPTLQYRRWRWRLTEHGLELEHGVILHQVRALPYFRIQHIDVEHGPLDRWLGLARLEVHTASVTGTLPGLHADQAPQIRQALLARAGDAVADTDDDAV